MYLFLSILILFESMRMFLFSFHDHLLKYIRNLKHFKYYDLISVWIYSNKKKSPKYHHYWIINRYIMILYASPYLICREACNSSQARLNKVMLPTKLNTFYLKTNISAITIKHFLLSLYFSMHLVTSHFKWNVRLISHTKFKLFSISNN